MTKGLKILKRNLTFVLHWWSTKKLKPRIRSNGVTDLSWIRGFQHVVLGPCAQEWPKIALRISGGGRPVHQHVNKHSRLFYTLYTVWGLCIFPVNGTEQLITAAAAFLYYSITLSLVTAEVRSSKDTNVSSGQLVAFALGKGEPVRVCLTSSSVTSMSPLRGKRSASKAETTQYVRLNLNVRLEDATTGEHQTRC